MYGFTKNSALVALVGIAFTLGAAAQNLKIQQLANPDFLNRNPSVSETGLITWQHTDLKADGAAHSKILLYRNGKLENLSSGTTWKHSACVFPKAVGSQVIWQTTFDDHTSIASSNFTWQLKEVPLQTNDIPELKAEYAATRSGDTPVSGIYTNAEGEVRTNELAVTQGATDWNFFPGLQTWPSPEEIPLVTSPGDPNIPRRGASGDNEIMMWDPTNGAIRLTKDDRNDLNPSIHQSLAAWQKAKAWPFGWEIMVYDGQDRSQLTTNYYYDMAPKVQDGQVAWYGWDGNDFEIFLYDHSKKEIKQLTDNTFDDVSPVLDDGVVVWEAYPAVEADIYLWKEGQDIIKLSENIEDDLNPRIWKGQVVWQGFDGDDFEIYRYDGEKTIKLTGNDYDDLNPDIHDGLICWMGYEENWDSEIFYWKGGDIITLTTNDFEDRYPKTAGGRIVWQGDELEKSYIFLASP